ncbi:MAG: PHP domain-containing protein, partial [Deltaproteobacteria bacterium]
MIDLHTHSLFSDGQLAPAELTRRFEVAGYRALAITDHGDRSNIDFIIPRLVAFCEENN